jgi:hypothetical protein
MRWDRAVAFVRQRCNWLVIEQPPASFEACGRLFERQDGA